ncbi:MAG: hypothetical protein CM1200mP2_40080 [Planctomycetaceae bacterium]|nr:MAG: hypothetical protein CM1200mP2_40080 [Planctomycetaceae bacterium]
MKAATGVKQNVDHGCAEIDTLLQVATLGFLTDAVRPVETAWAEGFDDERHWPMAGWCGASHFWARFVEQPLLLDCHVKAVAISPGLCEGCLPCKIVPDSSLA